MAFTQDELQSLNTIMEQKLSAQRHELERAFDKRLQGYKREVEQRLVQIQHDMMRAVSRDIKEQNSRFKESLQQVLERQYTRTLQSTVREIQQQHRHYEDLMERSLAAQLLAFEQLLNQRMASSSNDLVSSYIAETLNDFNTIEVQTEIPWEELVELIDQSFDERFNMLKTVLLNALKETERSLLAHMRSLQHGMAGYRQQDGLAGGNTPGHPLYMQEVFASIEQLEHLIEAMQVAMTANSALLSNRLFHHQQQPLERAHPTIAQNELSLNTSDSANEKE